MGMKDTYLPLCDALLTDAESGVLVRTLKVEATEALFKGQNGRSYRKIRAFDVSDASKSPMWGSAAPGKGNSDAGIAGPLKVSIYISSARVTFEYPGKPGSQVEVLLQPEPKAAPQAEPAPEAPQEASRQSSGAMPGWEGIFEQAFKGFMGGSAQPVAKGSNDRLWNAVENLIQVHVSSDERASRMRRAMAILFHADSGAGHGETLAKANALIDKLAPRQLVD